MTSNLVLSGGVSGLSRRCNLVIMYGSPGAIKPARPSSSCSKEVELFREAELELEDSSEEGSL